MSSTMTPLLATEPPTAAPRANVETPISDWAPLLAVVRRRPLAPWLLEMGSKLDIGGKWTLRSLLAGGVKFENKSVVASAK